MIKLNVLGAAQQHEKEKETADSRWYLYVWHESNITESSS